MPTPSVAVLHTHDHALPPSACCTSARQSIGMLEQLGRALQEAKFYRALRWVRACGPGGGGGEACVRPADVCRRH